jgi:hypothetical protein
MKLPKSAYSFLGLPQYYAGLSYSDTKLVPTKQKALQESMARAPTTGTLLVSGCSAPIINQFIELDKKCVGLSFPELFDDRFSDGDTTYPNSPVVLIYDIGMEPAKNKEFSATIINSIISYYKARDTLLLLETQLTPSNFSTTYGLTVKNIVSIQMKEEESWV